VNWQGLRIGLVGPLPPPEGGMANQTRQLAELLEGEGAVVCLVQTNTAYRPAWIERWNGVRALFRLVPYLIRLWRCAGQVDVFHVMANSGWSWHLFAAPAIWIARMRGVPVVVNYRGGEAASFLEQSVRWVRPSLDAASLLAVPSGFLHDVFARFGIRSEVLPNVVDLSRFRFAPREKHDAPHLVVTRNLEALYDIPTALRAFARVREHFPRARLSIAGTGPERERLGVLAASLGVAEAVRFTGRLAREDIAALYDDAHVMVNPSHVDNMPNCILEALACGVPVVSTRVGGVPYIVRDGVEALLVDAGDSQAMADAILRVLRDEQLAGALSAAGAADVQQFTWPRVRLRLAELYESALSSREIRVRAA
jgi:glycosyltransferase involved in cell wall biosynthesis